METLDQMEKMDTQETFESREFFIKAESLIKQGNYQEAAGLINEAIKIAPSNPRYISMMGLCIGMEGNVSAAEKMCRQALGRTKEPDPMMMVNLGKILLEQGRRNEARMYFIKAYNLDNTNARAALELSRMGVRKKPVIRFISRNHPLNIYLGKMRHRMIERRSKKLKKL